MAVSIAAWPSIGDWMLERVLVLRVQAVAECSQTFEVRSTTYRSAEDLET